MIDPVNVYFCYTTIVHLAYRNFYHILYITYLHDMCVCVLCAVCVCMMTDCLPNFSSISLPHLNPFGSPALKRLWLNRPTHTRVSRSSEKGGGAHRTWWIFPKVAKPHKENYPCGGAFRFFASQYIKQS